MTRTIYFDLDGTIANLYGVENWLEDLQNHNPRPYEVARPLVKMNSLARILNRLQKEGFEIAVVTWLAKGSTKKYDEEVTEVKKIWLKKHLASVKWNEMYFLPYGTPKENYIKNNLDVLFDDEEKNRKNWTGLAFDVNNILEVLKAI